jgi:hypothetical protein
VLFVGKGAAQVAPQLIPPGLLLTTPEPDPVFEIVKTDMGTGVNVAVTN